MLVLAVWDVLSHGIIEMDSRAVTRAMIGVPSPTQGTAEQRVLESKEAFVQMQP